MKRVTLKDIAQQLNVNTSTVSRALNDHPDISDDIKVKIQELAKKLNYRPNRMAASLRNSKSNIIGLIIPEITMFFFPSVIQGIEEIAQKNGFQLLVLQSNDSLEREQLNVQICIDHQVDGLLISLSKESQNIDHLLDAKALGIPIVLFDKSHENQTFQEVVIDDEDAVQIAMNHLFNNGHLRIGGLFGDPGMLITQRRVRQFKQALKKNGLEIEDHQIEFAGNISEGKNAAASLFKRFRPDAVFAMSDELIAALMAHTYDQNISVPLQCSVIGISDGLLPSLMKPSISHVLHSGLMVGKHSAQILIDQITNPDRIILSKKHIVPVELITLHSVSSKKL